MEGEGVNQGVDPEILRAFEEKNILIKGLMKEVENLKNMLDNASKRIMELVKQAEELTAAVADHFEGQSIPEAIAEALGLPKDES